MVSTELGGGSVLGLVRLLHLASPALPIGAYSYSQGLEWVVAADIVHDAPSAERWIGDVLECVIAQGEAPAAWRMLQSSARSDWDRFCDWNTWFLVSRESAELRAETAQMGAALIKLAVELDLIDEPTLVGLGEAETWTLPAAYALASRGFAIDGTDALTAYLWSWVENQVLAATKAVPLGQLAGQRLLRNLGQRIPAVVNIAQATSDDDVASFAPGLAIASSRHETQYTRIFRS
jgi:urease accessory protein